MQPPQAPSPEPGERRLLEHPPSDRYVTQATSSADPGAAEGTSADEATPLPDRERVLRGIAVGLAGAILMTLLGGPLSITAGLIGAAGAIGYVVGAVMRPLRRGAIVVAFGSVVLGLVGIWLFAGMEGGVLGPIEYLADVQGILVPIELLVAGVLAAVGSWSS
jgi:uncharacterized membrane protein YjjP (DUF1212 family)